MNISVPIREIVDDVRHLTTERITEKELCDCFSVVLKLKHIHVHTSSKPRMFQMSIMSVWMAFAQVIILRLEKPTPDVIALQYSAQKGMNIHKPARIVRI